MDSRPQTEAFVFGPLGLESQGSHTGDHTIDKLAKLAKLAEQLAMAYCREEYYIVLYIINIWSIRI